MIPSDKCLAVALIRESSRVSACGWAGEDDGMWCDKEEISEAEHVKKVHAERR